MGRRADLDAPAGAGAEEGRRTDLAFGSGWIGERTASVRPPGTDPPRGLSSPPPVARGPPPPVRPAPPMRSPHSPHPPIFRDRDCPHGGLAGHRSERLWRRADLRAGGAHREEVPRVVASIFPLADLAAWVGGDDVRIDVLVPPRAAPATFEPSPRQIRNLAEARGFLLVGGGIDDWLKAVPAALARIPETRMNDGIPLRAGGEGEGTGDPHTWLDPALVRDSWLPRIQAALIAAHPEAKDRLEARALALADSLSVLDDWLTQRLAPVRGPGLRRHPSGLGLHGGAIRATRAGHDSREPGARAVRPQPRRAGGRGARCRGSRCLRRTSAGQDRRSRACCRVETCRYAFSIRSVDRVWKGERATWR